MRLAALTSILAGALALVAVAQPLNDDAATTQGNGDSAALALAKRDVPDAGPSRLEGFAPSSTFGTDARLGTSDAEAQASSPAAAPATEPEADDTATATAQVDSGPVPDAAKSKAPVVPAKTIFGSIATPAPLAARAIGFYNRGCLAGAVPVPIDGETWQVMRLSRNRNWGHPKLVSLLERLAEDGAAKDGWPGLLVGDLSQPRGGPMLTGHNSHQIGLDADVWLTPMPDRRLTAQERESLAATSMLAKDGIQADPDVFTPHHAAIIRRAASYSGVERVLVHPGIKKAMCEEKGVDRTHFHKIRPYWGHHYHMHIRISCPPDSPGCRTQAPTPGDDGCGTEIDEWIQRLKKPPKPEPPVVATKPRPPPKPVTLADLPAECRTVVAVKPNDNGAAPETAAEPKTKAPRAAHQR